MRLNNPYLFIVGCARSGTTLLQRMLHNHPDLAVANDTHFIFEAITGLDPPNTITKGLSPGIDPPLTTEVVESVHNYRTFKRMKLSEAGFERAITGNTTYREFVSAVYTEFCHEHGKSLAGEKSGRYANYQSFLHAWFPQAKFIHIIRDGRDVALSAQGWNKKRGPRGPGKFLLWSSEPTAACAMWWADRVREGRKQGGLLGSVHYFEIRYEALIANPEQILKSLIKFLELPYSDSLMQYHQGKTRHNPKLSSKKSWLPPTAGLRNWKTEMNERDQMLFESLVGDLLIELGYERHFQALPSGITTIAQSCKQHWDTELTHMQGARD